MKKTLLTLIGLSLYFAVQSQNYIGKSKAVIENSLDNSGIEYEEYINGRYKTVIKYNQGEDERHYIFDFKGICNKYMITSSRYDFFQDYASKFINAGYKEIKSKLALYEFKKNDIRVLFYEVEENDDVDYMFFIVVQKL